MDWSTLYPEMPASAKVEFADVGCGYGGLLVSLAPIFPDKYILGMEIRVKVASYVQQRIEALRANSTISIEEGSDDLKAQATYQNIAVLRSNSMKFLPNMFRKGQLSKMFFLFPDPHFKRKKHKARIISPTLLSEYAYVLRPEGLLYTVTDVLDLHEWMKSHLDDHPLFERVPDTDLTDDPVIPCVMTKTEEGLKVERGGGDKYLAVYRRILHEGEK
jgi:tRNA (guanine-N7-)-methyltransferase